MKPPLPERIGRYEIVDRLGAGGMGVVYLATDPLLRRSVAIKLLPGNDEELRERFAREARSAAALTHNHVVTIYDVGEDEGRPFIAMEFLSGESMSEMIRRRAPLSMERRLQLMIDLCSGLGYAHRNGIIHRDIKPANLMITSEGVLKILDFGLARITTDASQTGLTRAGALMGTPHYMSPEQIEGVELDEGSDIFAVGLVLYELLTYQKAYPGDSAPVVLHNILHKAPTPIRELLPTIDSELEEIVNHAIEKDRGRRYGHLRQLAEELESVRERLEESSHDATIVEERPAASKPKTTPVPEVRWGRSLDAIAQRRTAQIELHLTTAAQHFASGNYESTIEQCEHAIVLDPNEGRALDLLDRAHRALDDRQIHEWLESARTQLASGSLSEAQGFIDKALEVRAQSSEALELQSQVKEKRRERERAAERVRTVRAAMERARKNLDAGAFEAAIRCASEALAHDPEHAEAKALKQQATAALDEERRRRAHEEAAAALVARARRALSIEELSQAVGELRAFAPPHAAVASLADELDARIAELERLRREEEERRRQRAIEEKRRRDAAARHKAAAREALAEERFEEALAALADARREWPEDPEVVGLIAATEAARAEAHRLELERERQAQLQRDADTAALAARRLAAVGDLEGAIRLLEAFDPLELVAGALEELRREHARVEALRREAETRRRAEEEARKKAAEEERQRELRAKAEAEEREKQRRAQAEAEARAAEEGRRRAEQEAKRRAEEEARRVAAEKERLRKEREEKARAEELERQRQAKAEAEARAAEERRLRAEAEAEERRRRAAAEAEARARDEERRRHERIERERAAEAERQRLEAEAEARARAAEAERLRKEQAEQARAEEAERRRLAKEEERQARLRAKEEERRRREEEANERRAAKARAAEEARLAAEEATLAREERERARLDSAATTIERQLIPGTGARSVALMATAAVLVAALGGGIWWIASRSEAPPPDRPPEGDRGSEVDHSNTVREAQQKYDAGDISGAVAAAVTVPSTAPAHAGALAILTRIRSDAAARTETARAEADRAGLSSEPGFTDALDRQAAAAKLLQPGETLKAVAAFDEATALFRKIISAGWSPARLAQEARREYAARNQARAVDLALQAIEKDPRNRDAHALLETVRLAAASAAEAAALRARKAGASEKNSPSFREAQTREAAAKRLQQPRDTVAALQSYADAQARYIKSIDEVPAPPTIDLNALQTQLGRAEDRLQARDLAGAAAALQEAERISPAEPRLADLRRRIDALKRSLDDEAVEKAAIDGILAEAARAGDNDAIKILQQGLTKYPRNAQLSSALGRRQQARDQRIGELADRSKKAPDAQAVELLKQALALNPERDDIRSELAARMNTAARARWELDIREVLEQYEAAYESLDVNAFLKVATYRERGSVEQEFRQFRAIRLDIQRIRVVQIDGNGSSAVVTCTIRTEAEPAIRSNRLITTRDWEFRFTNANGAWRIAGAVPGPPR